MGRPTPSVLFSQSFRHYHPGEHVDEVRFSEPVVITACEILDQQATSLSRPISLTGVTSPPSFSVEIFVRNGGDARFKRLCHPFLYSASAPPLEDAQVAVTDHLVLRGTYDSLTLVLYGNPASSIGHLSCEHDLDSPLPDLLLNEVPCRFEDLPEALHPQRAKFSAPFPPLQYLQLVHINTKNTSVIWKVLQLAGQTGQAPLDVKSLHKIVKSLVSAAASVHISESSHPTVPSFDIWPAFDESIINEGSEQNKELSLLLVAKKELLELQAQLQEKEEDKPGEEVQTVQGLERVEQNDVIMKSESSDLILELILHWIQGSIQLSDMQNPALLPIESLIGGLAAAQLLCTDAQECYRFVLAGGLHLLMDVLQHVVGNFSATTLLALGAVECASRYAFGCEALLGWWSPDAALCGENGDPGGTSRGYSVLVQFLLQPQQQPVVQLAARVLHRLRAYELTAAIQSIVEIFIEEPASTVKSSCDGENDGKAIGRAAMLIKQLLGLLRIREVSPKEGPSSRFCQWLAPDGEDIGTLLPPCSAYGGTASTSSIIAKQDIDPYLLLVLQERRLLPMLVALVSAPRLRSLQGQAMKFCTELVGVIEAVLLALLNCRSGLLLLAHDTEVSTALLTSFQRLQELHEKDLAPLRHATALTSAGFLCHPRDFGGMFQTCLSVISAMDRLLGAHAQSEESLWALWDLSTISRLESGQQALLMLTWFPEVMTLLVGAFHTGPEASPVLVFGETWRRAAMHFVAEVLQVVVSDPAAPTVAAWTPRAMAMQRALLASTAHMDGSFTSNAGGYEEKDGACSGLLEWLDSAVVYHKKGAVGLLKYASAILAGGSGIPQTSFGLLAGDNMDIDANTGDQAVNNDIINVAVPYQGKWTSAEATALPLSDTAIVQLTVAFRILSLVSCYPGVAAVLYGEGAMAVVYSILDQCSTALQSCSSAYDTTVEEEDLEFDGTAEDLGNHAKEHLLLELLLPVVLFLLALLQNLQVAVQNYQNTKLVDVLLLLHLQMSSCIASYVSAPPYAWSGITQDFIAVRQVLASVLVCWPVFGWTPPLFPRLLGMDNSSNMLSPVLPPMEPAMTCSILSLLADMFPTESPQLCNSKSSVSDMYRSLVVDSILGCQTSSAVSWHNQSPYSDQLMRAVVLYLDQIGEVVLHHTSTGCAVLQDTIKLFIIRLACTNMDHAVTIMRLIINQIRDQSAPSMVGFEKESFQVERTIQLVAGLALHPASKLVLLREGIIEVLLKACSGQSQPLTGGAASSDTDAGFPDMGQWLWIVRAFTGLCDPDISLVPLSPIGRRNMDDCPSFGDCCSIVSCLLNLLQVVPIGKEFEVVLEGFEKLSSHKLGRAAIGYIAIRRQRLTSSVDSVMTDLGKSEALNNGNILQLVVENLEGPQSPIFLDIWQRIRSTLESDKCTGLVLISVIQHFAMSSLVLSGAGKRQLKLQGLLSAVPMIGVFILKLALCMRVYHVWEKLNVTMVTNHSQQLNLFSDLFWRHRLSTCGMAALSCLLGLGQGHPIEESGKEEKLASVISIAAILREYVTEESTGRMSSTDIHSLSSVPAPTIQEAYAALMAMLRIIKRPEIGKELTGKALLVMEGHAAAVSAHSTRPQQVKSRAYVCAVTALAFLTKQDTDFEDIGNPDEYLLEKDLETYGLDSRGTLVWECPTLLHDRPVLQRTSSKRKTMAMIEVSRKRHGIDISASPLADGQPTNGIGSTPGSWRPLPASVTPLSVLNRRDTFRQRKPNTSRPPSMHVDDYVARERSEVITSGSSPVPVQRSTSGSGRPPSIHVDEFMAKQQERQQLSATSSGVDEQLLLAGRNVSLPLVDASRRIISGLAPGAGKMSEEEGQISTTPQDKGYEQQWEELSVAESAAVGPGTSTEFLEPSHPTASAPSNTADVRSEKTSSSTSSISTTTDSVHSVKTPQVADMLLLQSKVTLQTTVARNLGGIMQTQTEEILQTVGSSAVEQLRDGSKRISGTLMSSATHSMLDKKPSVPFHLWTSEPQSSSKIPGGEQTVVALPLTKQELSESQAAKDLQAMLRQSSKLSRPGNTDFATMKVFSSLGSEQVGPSQLSSGFPTLSDPQLRKFAPPMPRLDPQNLGHSVSSESHTRQLPSTSAHAARQLKEPTTPILHNVNDSQASTLTKPSPSTVMPYNGPQLTSSIPSREHRSLQSIPGTDTSSNTFKGVVMSSHATDPRPRPRDKHGEKAATDVSRPVVPPPPASPWPQEATQPRPESTLPSTLTSLLSARPSPSYASLSTPGPQWPSGEVISKGAPLPHALENLWPVHAPNARFVDESGVPYGIPGRPAQPPGNPPLPVGLSTPHGAIQFPPTNVAPPPSTPPLKGGVVALDNIPGSGPSGSHSSPRESRFSAQLQSYNTLPSLLQPMSYIPPPVPAGRPSTPHASALPINIPTHQQQLQMQFQQQNIIKLQQQQHQLQQHAQSQQVQQLHHQQHLLGPLPMSVQVPLPLPVAPPAPPLPPPPPPPPPTIPAPAIAQPQQRSQQQVSSALLQQMLVSPDAIQALLKDQNKLRELLEKHPKLISLLQERMSQAPA